MEGHIYVASSSSSGVHMGLAPQEKAREEEDQIKIKKIKYVYFTTHSPRYIGLNIIFRK
jgi:hypothetical protein